MSQTTDSGSDRYERGWRKLAEVDENAGKQVVEGLSNIAPDLGRYIIEFAFGDLYKPLSSSPSVVGPPCFDLPVAGLLFPLALGLGVKSACGLTKCREREYSLPITGILSSKSVAERPIVALPLRVGSLRMIPEDTNYYRARAAQERQVASIADKQYVAEIHLELARQYDALAEVPELRPKLRMFG